MNPTQQAVQIITIISLFFISSNAIGQQEDIILPGQNQVTQSWEDSICNRRSYDFGDIGVGKEGKHVFELTNSENTALIVDKILVSCGCMSARLSQRTINPGNTVKLSVFLETDKFRGKKNATITVRFKNPIRELQFAASVNIRNLIIEPESIRIDNLSIGEKQTKTLTVVRGGSPFWKITKLESTSENVVPKVLSHAVDGYKVTYQIGCEVIGSEGLRPNQSLTIFSNDSQESKFEIPLTVLTSKPIEFSVDSLDFGRINKATTKTVVLKTQVESEIESLKVDSEAFTAVQLKPGSAKAHFLKITCQEVENPAKGSLVVKLKDSDLSAQLKLTANTESGILPVKDSATSKRDDK